ncbi:protein P54-like [Paramacrobiotus metropolitanus]|uniref:protein P54-like n=1 Tax=Paramacrobiotus metropolitanus TaxID=2943436 RepID=UPI002445FD3B|nr:protein P54-like [Paramacrobiotus metropolitanus]
MDIQWPKLPAKTGETEAPPRSGPHPAGSPTNIPMPNEKAISPLSRPSPTEGRSTQATEKSDKSPTSRPVDLLKKKSPLMFELGDSGSGTPPPMDDVFDTTQVSRPSSRDGFFRTPVAPHLGNHRYQASTLEYTARKWIASTPPEKIEDIDRLRKRCQDLITQIVLADQIVNSTENQMSRSEDTHKLERKRWEKEPAEANNGIAAQQRRIEHLESHLKRSDNPCRYDFEEIERLQSTLATSVESVFELKRRLATVEKDLADTQTALVESELAAGTFHQQLKQANEEAEVYRNEVDRYIVELKQADDEVDRQKYRIEQLEREMETLLVRAGRQLMAHYGQQPASPDRSRATTDLEQANAQLADQVYGLNDALKEEQRLRAQLEHSLAEAQKVYEAQQNRIAHLEVRENDLYNYGLDADKYIDDLNRYIDEMTTYTDDLDTEVRCLQEETKHLEQSRTEPPSYRTSMATDFHFEPSQTVREILWDIKPKEEKKEQNFFVGVVTTNPLIGTPPQQQPLPHRPEPERNTSTAAPHVPTSNVPTTTTATSGTYTSTTYATHTSMHAPAPTTSHPNGPAPNQWGAGRRLGERTSSHPNMDDFGRLTISDSTIAVNELGHIITTYLQEDEADNRIRNALPPITHKTRRTCLGSDQQKVGHHREGRSEVSMEG